MDPLLIEVCPGSGDIAIGPVTPYRHKRPGTAVEAQCPQCGRTVMLDSAHQRYIKHMRRWLTLQDVAP